MPVAHAYKRFTPVMMWYDQGLTINMQNGLDVSNTSMDPWPGRQSTILYMHETDYCTSLGPCRNASLLVQASLLKVPKELYVRVNYLNNGQQGTTCMNLSLPTTPQLARQLLQPTSHLHSPFTFNIQSIHTHTQG